MNSILELFVILINYLRHLFLEFLRKFTGRVVCFTIRIDEPP